MRAVDVEVTVPNGRRILGPVSVTFAPGEWVSIIGRNGAGKTTLCHVLSGATRPASGTVIRDGSVGLLSQGPTRPTGLTTLEYALLGVAGRWGAETIGQVERARRSLALCALDPDQGIGSLSGGEFRKAGIARLLTLDPSVLVLDEPTAGLDPNARIEMFELLEEIRGDRIVITVMHDLTTAAQFGHRYLVMADGVIVADGARSEVLTSRVLQSAFGDAVSVVEVDGEMLPVTRRGDGKGAGGAGHQRNP